MSEKKIVLAVIGDSPKLHTGFGTVLGPLCKEFVAFGFEVHVLGLLDHDEDVEGKLPYDFDPVPQLDDLAHNTYSMWLRKVKPDVIFMLTDPGNAMLYLHGLVENRKGVQFRDGVAYFPPVVLYTPIEGTRISKSAIDGFDLLRRINGSLVVYCQAAKKAVQAAAPFLDEVYVVYHGLDHADFRRYSDADRRMLRQMVGLDDYFVVGAIGANKRTKGFPTLIYAAAYLREQGLDEGIKFYCHTNPDFYTMDGYILSGLAKYYGVDDMFLWTFFDIF